MRITLSEIYEVSLRIHIKIQFIILDIGSSGGVRGKGREGMVVVVVSIQFRQQTV